uniref:Secreted protein n=1 Tax=Arabidopsis thaliana TaxID=3702 RepID=Q0WMR9_ARATH|nr:hypothetical protein [Arabidopsis thaliana]
MKFQCWFCLNAEIVCIGLVRCNALCTKDFSATLIWGRWAVVIQCQLNSSTIIFPTIRLIQLYSNCIS